MTLVSAEVPSRSSRDRLTECLRVKFSERNYATEYIARRCRTSPDAVSAWLAGTRLPTTGEWEFLLCVSRDFSDLAGLWREAWSEYERESRIEIGAGEVSDPIGDAPLVPRPAVNSAVEIEVNASVAPSAAPLVSVPGERPRVMPMPLDVPTGFDWYTCKIGGGRMVGALLPSAFSRADASRVYAFLLTQADDFVLPGDTIGLTAADNIGKGQRS